MRGIEAAASGRLGRDPVLMPAGRGSGGLAMTVPANADERLRTAEAEVRRLVATYHQDRNGSVTRADIAAAVEERWSALLATGWTPPRMTAAYAALCDECFGMDAKTLMDVNAEARRTSRRRENLSFSHHRGVADLDKETAEARRQLRARLLEAGATLSTGATGKRVHLTAWVPGGTDKALLDEAKADGWVVVTGKPFGWQE